MRATVTNPFYDKEKRTLHLKPGEELTLTAERFHELSKKGYVAEIPEEAPAQKEDKQAAQRLTKEEKATRKTK